MGTIDWTEIRYNPEGITDGYWCMVCRCLRPMAKLHTVARPAGFATHPDLAARLTQPLTVHVTYCTDKLSCTLASEAEGPWPAARPSSVD